MNGRGRALAGCVFLIRLCDFLSLQEKKNNILWLLHHKKSKGSANTITIESQSLCRSLPLLLFLTCCRVTKPGNAVFR